MAPVQATPLTGGTPALLAAPAIVGVAVRHAISRRDLTVTSDSQKTTLGVIAAYVVVIALLWNLPYVRWVLWPFKVSVLFVSTRCMGRARRAWALRTDRGDRCL
jgi:hypothetical protein